MKVISEFAQVFLERFQNVADKITEYISIFFINFEKFDYIYTHVVRIILPVLAATIFLRCIFPLLRNWKQNTALAYLHMPDGTKTPIRHWENSIGRSKLSDIVINLSFVSRTHAVITYRNGGWLISDLGSKGGVKVNNQVVEKSMPVNDGDTISIAGYDMILDLSGFSQNFDESNLSDEAKMPLYKKKILRTGLTFMLILLFQCLGGIQILASAGDELNKAVPLTLIMFIVVEYTCFVVFKSLGKRFMELELLTLFLCGLNLLILSSASPDSLYKQLGAIVAGIIAYFVLTLILSNLDLARKVKYLLVVGALGLLVLNLVLGETRFGAKNWINLGFITIQPMEFVKIAFVIAGTATLDKLLTTRNITYFIGFSGACIGVLVLIRDFGTAVVFFGAFLVIAFMRSGDWRTIALITAGAALGAITVISFIPYVASRFKAWGHVWEYADTSGFQQTRTMIYAASGGLFGVGGGNGYLKYIAAADTDLVFGVISEEWGILIAVMVFLIIVFYGIYAVFLTKGCRSSFYAIAACGAASMFLIQTALNVFGSVDILPLTGVTLPFVSNGGSSMMASWSLLAFIKSADHRIRPEKVDAHKRKGGRG